MSKGNALKVGQSVTPTTNAGLWLANECRDGSQDCKLTNACVFYGIGKILEVQTIVIDYDTWLPIYSDIKIGEIQIHYYKIACDNGIGWGSSVIESKK